MAPEKVICERLQAGKSTFYDCIILDGDTMHNRNGPLKTL